MAKKTSKSSFRGKVSQAVKTDKAKASSYGYLKLPNGVSVFSPEVSADKGKNYLLDFAPYLVTSNNHPEKDEKAGIAIKDSYWWRFPFKVHRNVGAGTGDTVVCLATFGKKCPICEERAKRAKAGADKDELKSMSASDRYLYIVNPLDSPKHDAGKWHIFDVSKAMFQKLLNDEIEEESVSEVFMDLEEGETLKVRFTGKVIGNSKPFAEATKIISVERDKPYKLSVADETPRLDEILNVLTYEQMEHKFFEIEEEEEVDDIDEDEKPVRKKVQKVEEDNDDPAPVRKKKVAPVDDDEDEADNITWDTIKMMSAKELKKFIVLKEIELDPDDYIGFTKSLQIDVAYSLGVTGMSKSIIKIATIPFETRCLTCEGSGKDSEGGVCEDCMGTGVKPAKKSKKVAPVDDDDDDEKPVKKSTKVPAKKATADDKCPSDHIFGKDVDKFDECDSCDLWDECNTLKKKNSKK